VHPPQAVPLDQQRLGAGNCAEDATLEPVANCRLRDGQISSRLGDGESGRYRREAVKTLDCILDASECGADVLIFGGGMEAAWKPDPKKAVPSSTCTTSQIRGFAGKSEHRRPWITACAPLIRTRSRVRVLDRPL